MKKLLLLAMSVVLFATQTLAAGDYLIMENIGSCAPVFDSLRDGVSGGDAVSGTYRTYALDYAAAGERVVVEISIHDDARWLAHTIEGRLRHTSLGDQLGKLSETAQLKEFVAGNVFWLDTPNGYFWWVHDNLAVQINGKTDLAVIEAYISKWPPTHSVFTPDAVWVVNEMERLLESAGARLGLLGQDAASEDTPAWVNRELNAFLQYRDRHFGVAATDERIALGEALRKNDESLMREKFSEYSQWWAANKE